MLDSIFQTELAPMLSAWETQLETPIVPGELADWLKDIEEDLGDLLPALREHIERRHRDDINEIAEQDDGQFAHVAQLRKEDRKIMTEAERQFRVVTAIANNSDQLEPDEARATPAVERIVNDGLQLVIRIRKQEAALATWLGEAFDRDRGEGD